MLGLFFALVLGMFLGTEYSDGTLRNKLVVGHTRREVYLAHLVTGMGVAALFTAAVFLAGMVGIPGLGMWKMGPGGVVLSFLVSLGFNMALTALFALVGMLSEKKATTAVTVILLFLAMAAFSSWLNARLGEPELDSGIIITAQGVQWSGPPPQSPVYRWSHEDFLPVSDGDHAHGTGHSAGQSGAAAAAAQPGGFGGADSGYYSGWAGAV